MGPCVWSEDTLEESVLWYSVGLGSGTQAGRLGKQVPLPAELSLRPLIFIVF